jgi:hypothetical protein
MEKIQNIEQKLTVSTTVTTVASFSVKINKINLFKSATLCVKLFNEKNEFVGLKHLELNGDNYTNWGSDDNYINNFVATQLEFTLQNSPSATTDVPTTDVPTTDVPTTDVPTTDVPTTDVPTTDVPTTDVPTTDVPTTDVPTTDVPTTDVQTFE